MLVGVEKSWALLPDDDDVDLLSKAKARRKQRIQEELATEKKFVRDEGFRSFLLSDIHVPTLLTLATLRIRSAETKKLRNSVQTAVYNLAISGNMIGSGELSKE